jgi:hypothetical protein
VLQTMSANALLSFGSSLKPFHSAIDPTARITKPTMDRTVRASASVPSTDRPLVERSVVDGSAAPAAGGVLMRRFNRAVARAASAGSGCPLAWEHAHRGGPQRCSSCLHAIARLHPVRRLAALPLIVRCGSLRPGERRPVQNETRRPRPSLAGRPTGRCLGLRLPMKAHEPRLR